MSVSVIVALVGGEKGHRDGTFVGVDAAAENVREVVVVGARDGAVECQEDELRRADHRPGLAHTFAVWQLAIGAVIFE